MAQSLPDRAAFTAAAREVAERFGPSAVAVLRKRFHKTTPPPAEFDHPKAPLGAWLGAWQFAIFEVLYHLREPALPLVRKVAFGVYDWTQGNAIEILCRWAAEGFDRERTLRDLKNKMAGMRLETLLYAAGPLLAQIGKKPALRAVVDELRCVSEFEQACKDVGQ